MGRKLLTGLVVFIVLENVFGAFFLLDYYDVVSSYAELKTEFQDLRDVHLRLEKDYQTLNVTYWTLRDRYSDLEKAYNNLTVDHSLLVTKYEDLERLYNSLAQNYSSLEGTLKVEEVLRIGNSLQSYYDLVREKKGLDGTKGSLNPIRDQVIFAAKLALHDLGKPYLAAVEAEFEEEVGERSYRMARRIIDEVLLLIDVNDYDPPVVKVGKVLNFTYRYIHYECEVNNVYRAPVETLGLRSGDCDDYAILVAALFKAVGIESAIGSFKNATEAYHYMVLIHVDDLPGYEYWSFSDLTEFGLAEGKWILIEPQAPLEYQEKDWLKQWILLAAAAL